MYIFHGHIFQKTSRNKWFPRLGSKRSTFNLRAKIKFRSEHRLTIEHVFSKPEFLQPGRQLFYDYLCNQLLNAIMVIVIVNQLIIVKNKSVTSINFCNSQSLIVLSD